MWVIILTAIRKLLFTFPVWIPPVDAESKIKSKMTIFLIDGALPDRDR